MAAETEKGKNSGNINEIYIVIIFFILVYERLIIA